MDGNGDCRWRLNAARRLNVCLVVLFSDFGIPNTNPEDICAQKTFLFQAEPRATTPAEGRFLALSALEEWKNHYCAAARCRPLSSIRKKNLRYYGAKIVFTMQAPVCKKTSCVRSLNGRRREEPLMLGKRTCFLDAATMGFCAVHRRVQIYNGDYSGGGIPGLGRDHRSVATLTPHYVFHGGTVTGLRYRDEILDPYVRPYAAAIGNDFILMDDSARPHRARIVEEYLEHHGFERMETWPSLDHPGHGSDSISSLGLSWQREVAASLNPPPRSLSMS
ncbi:uncharacterized protein TNCV_1680241 [Trichonephila clavipes]|nr:uncharacterized protein TNCV_1680241 [Trichonephila clavipes]